MNDFREYDTQTNTWRQLTPVPGPGRSGAIGFSLGNFGYVGAGNVASTQTPTPVNDMYKYDPATDQWTIAFNMGNVGRARGSVFTIGNKAYVVGGFAGIYSYTPTVFVFDGSSEIWNQLNDFPGLPREYGGTFVLSGKGYLIGGYNINWDSSLGNGSDIFLKDNWEYNPSNDSWIQKAPLPQNFSYVGEVDGFSVANKGYAIAETSLGSPNFAKFDPTINQWTQLSQSPAEGFGITVTKVCDLAYTFNSKIVYQYLHDDYNIAGSSTVCATNSTFTLNNLPVGTIPSWQATPANLFAVSSGTGSSATLRAANTTVKGQGTITFTIANSCGTPFTEPKSVWVGKPSFQLPIEGPDQLLIDHSGQYLVPYALGASVNSNYTWVMPAGWTLYTSGPTGNGHSATIIPGSVGFKTIQVNTSNVCGSSYSQKTIECVDECSSQLSAYPNPSKGDVVINIIPPPGDCDPSVAFSSLSTQSSSLVLRNGTGEKVIEKDFTGSETEIKGLGLKPGLYYLKVQYQGKILEQKLVIN